MLNILLMKQFLINKTRFVLVFEKVTSLINYGAIQVKLKSQPNIPSKNQG